MSAITSAILGLAADGADAVGEAGAVVGDVVGEMDTTTLLLIGVAGLAVGAGVTYLMMRKPAAPAPAPTPAGTAVAH
jgi:hypothetical protein